eukprot:TRINITY_DN13566_c0_g1_i1.p1 TRINITY_DN13566_c0_g1~~TRINITY_DN13566_c0_g1_i1.p1  ORF type:complete len:265 (-),score=75.22 TRINITY_DN13566_c0_g1_i1:84-878(-)
MFSSASVLFGNILCETGSKLSQIGAHFKGVPPPVLGNVHKKIKPFQGQRPSIGQGAWVAPSAVVVGKVEIGEKSSLWYGSVVRGDVNHIKIGKKTNIQDRVVIHVASKGPSGFQKAFPTIVGDNVTVEAGALLHACTIENNVRIGMGAKILDGVTVGTNSIISAGALVTAGKTIPSGELWSGSPAVFVRKLTAEEIESNKESAENMLKLANQHDESSARTDEELTHDLLIEEYYAPDTSAKPFSGVPSITPATQKIASQAQLNK